MTAAALSPDEVAQLWSFVHGDIMDTGIRQRLLSFLGLCPRHTWGYAVVEIELWQSGAGIRGGHQPFDVAVLYEGLLDHVANALDKTGRVLHRDHRSALIGKGTCYICDLLSQEGVPGLNRMPTGYAGSRSADLAAEANQLTYTTAWCRETRPLWHQKVCTACAAGIEDGSLEDAAGSPTLCRQHLLAADTLTPESKQRIVADLRDTAARLRNLAQSMTKDGRPARPQDDSSWIEALGWFAGWGLPLALTASTDG
jgi:hypothetical protein